MNKLVEQLKILSENIPLEQEWKWKVPESAPISIPKTQSNFNQNIYLKNNLRDSLLNDPELKNHYWIIQQWGEIRSFKKNERNDQRIEEFKVQLDQGKLKKPTFSLISSLSKVASFLQPEKYSIYDSRAVYALNWLLFCYSDEKGLYPQPPGRNAELIKYDIQTITRLSNSGHQYRSYRTAYHDYCRLLILLSKEIYGDENPHKLEMLLFLAAPKQIVGDIGSSIKLTINRA